MTVAAPPGTYPFEIETRPAFEADVLAAYEAGRRLVQEKRMDDGVRSWRAVVDRARSSDPVSGCWLLARMGTAWSEAGRRAEFEQAYKEALECARDAEPIVTSSIRAQEARQALTKRWLEVADQAFGALLEPTAAMPGPLAKAEALAGLGSVRFLQGATPEAIELTRQALSIQESQAPESLPVIRSLHALGLSLAVAGEHEEAERTLTRAEALAARIAPGWPTQAGATSLLAGVALGRGDLVRAQQLWERALEMTPPDNVTTQASLHLNLGVVAAHRGDLESSESWARGGLQFAERSGNRRQQAALLESLGGIASMRGDFEEAEGLLRRALEERDALYPYQAAAQLIALAWIRLERSDPVEAKALFEEAAARGEKASLGTLLYAGAWLGLADLARAERDWTRAEMLYRRVLAAVPGTEPVGEAAALSLQGLARVQLARDRDDEAEISLARAVAALEAVRGQTARSEEARSLLHSRNYGIYHDRAELLVKRGRIDEAFGVLELSRARAFLALVAERDLILDDEIPVELERQRRGVEAEYQRAYKSWLESSEGKDAAKKDSLSVRLTDLRRRQIEIADKIRAASPRLAEVRYPEPRSLAEIQASLEPGTLLLVYSTGAEGVLLFAVTREALEAIAIPIADADLRRRVARWRGLAEQSVPQPEFHKEARALFDLLLKPVDRQLVEARRVLISPSGPLHTLPFAVLRRGELHVGGWKPLTVVPSGTVSAQWSKRRREARPGRSLVAFADPLRPAAGFDTLPATRPEVTALARSVGKESLLHFGEAATEDQARRLDKNSRYVHFACHGLINERRPLDSGLVLHAPAKASGGDDGLLQAWEIYERVRIDADLVTLSACDSGSGTVRAGEGLLGLTRAFHYAGARSVLASLWSVGDKSSLWFMERYYGELARGAAKDEALQRTQQAAIRAGRRPATWAAYQLYGDWR